LVLHPELFYAKADAAVSAPLFVRRLICDDAGRRLQPLAASVYSQRRRSAMNIIAWILVGLIGGTLAKVLMPGRDPGGIILTALLGIGGAILGGFLSVALGLGNGVDDFDVGTIFLAVVGAMLILGGYRLVTRSA